MRDLPMTVDMERTPTIDQSIGSHGGQPHAAPEPGSPVPEADKEAVPGTGTPKPGSRRPSLGSLLVQTRVASKQQVKYAVAEGLETGEKLGEVIVRRGWATYEDLAELLAEQWQLPFSSGAALAVDPSAAELIPLADARELGALPIGFEGDRVLVAIAEPSENLLKAVARRLGPTSYIVIPRTALDSLLGEPPPDRVKPDKAEPVEVEVEVEGTEVEAAGEDARLAHVDADQAETGERSELPSKNGVRATAGSGTIAKNALSSLEAAVDELQRIHHEVTALGESLALAREQLAESEAELEAAQEANDQYAVTIGRLESDISEQNDLFEILKAQVTTLNTTLGVGPEL